MSAAKSWHPRVEMRWRIPSGFWDKGPVLEQLWQCQETEELWWRAVAVVTGWEQSEPWAKNPPT